RLQAQQQDDAFFDTVQEYQEDLEDLARKLPDVSRLQRGLAEERWIRVLRQSVQHLHDAQDRGRDDAARRGVLADVNEVFRKLVDAELPRINSRLMDAAGELALQ